MLLCWSRSSSGEQPSQEQLQAFTKEPEAATVLHMEVTGEAEERLVGGVLPLGEANSALLPEH